MFPCNDYTPVSAVVRITSGKTDSEGSRLARSQGTQWSRPPAQGAWGHSSAPKLRAPASASPSTFLCHHVEERERGAGLSEGHPSSGCVRISEGKVGGIFCFMYARKT